MSVGRSALSLIHYLPSRFITGFTGDVSNVRADLYLYRGIPRDPLP